MNIGILGYGNMGSAIINGILNLNEINKIYVYDIDENKIKNIKDKSNKIEIADMFGVINESDYIILAIKPQDFVGLKQFLAGNIKYNSAKKRIIISIMAGIRLNLIKKWIVPSDHFKFVRVMPNTPALINKGVSGIYFDKTINNDEKAIILKLFNSIGVADEVKKEELIDVITGLSGSGPAFVFEFIKALSDGAVMEGLPRDIADKFAIHTVLGAAELLKNNSGVSFETQKERIMSPGGTTAKGLFVLEKNAFHGIVMEAVKAASDKAKEIGDLYDNI